MDLPLNIVIGVVATALPLGFLAAWLLRDWRSSRAAVVGAVAAAVIWATGYGIYAWQHRMDWEHIRNYPLWNHIVLTTFPAVAYGLIAFLPAFVGAVFSHKLTRKRVAGC